MFIFVKTNIHLLSVLIPTFNYDVTNLVFELRRQCVELDFPFEIICADDCFCDNVSGEKNNVINDWENCNYTVNIATLGRAKNRNELARLAKYPNLLFIDSDAEICNSSFIKNYTSFFNRNIVVIGGVRYTKNEPESLYILRWKYGIFREMKSAECRNKNPYASFTPFNMLVPKSVFDVVEFDETLNEYGHEDTLFGLELQKKNIEIVHIENALLHKGLDETSEFLVKTKQACINLRNIYGKYKKSHEKLHEIKLIRMAELVHKMRFNTIFLLIYSLFQHRIIHQLKGRNPILFLYDLYKLNAYLQSNETI